jgi:hypothetical protein
MNAQQLVSLAAHIDVVSHINLLGLSVEGVHITGCAITGDPPSNDNVCTAIKPS